MKLILTLVISFFLSVDCYSQQLDQSLNTIATEIAQKVSNKKRVKLAVTDFVNSEGKEDALTKYIRDELELKLINSEKDLQVIDRKHIKLLLSEHHLQSEGLIDETTAKSAIEFIKVDGWVIAEITNLGEQIKIKVSVIDVTTSQIYAASASGAISDEAIKNLLEPICNVCKGTGFVTIQNVCTSCNGKGSIECKQCGGTGTVEMNTWAGHYETCGSCKGTGKFTCGICSGKGKITNTQKCSKCKGYGKLLIEPITQYKDTIIKYKETKNPQGSVENLPLNENDCAKKQTGNYCFKNNTSSLLYVMLWPGTGWYKEITVDPGQTQYFYNIRARDYNYVIGHKKYTWYKSDAERSGQILVTTCQTGTFEIEEFK